MDSKWSRIASSTAANDTEKFNPRLTITSRYLGLMFISIFDTWLRYGEKAELDYL